MAAMHNGMTSETIGGAKGDPKSTEAPSLMPQCAPNDYVGGELIAFGVVSA